VGVKVVDPESADYLAEVIDSVDFVEFTAILDKDYGFVKDHGVPTVIHNMHSIGGSTSANPTREELNRRSLENSIRLADEFDAKHVIVHPDRRGRLMQRGRS